MGVPRKKAKRGTCKQAEEGRDGTVVSLARDRMWGLNGGMGQLRAVAGWMMCPGVPGARPLECILSEGHIYEG